MSCRIPAFTCFDEMTESNAGELPSDGNGRDLPTTIEQWAQAYRARGWSVIPLRPRDKRPLMSWAVFQKRLPDADEIRSWYAHHPDANVGIVTGRLSGIIVLDVDARHGGDGSLDKLERRQGPLSCSLMSITGGGGKHFYFAHPGGTEIRNRVGLYPGIDLRGDGGYIVAPPSLHPSGNRYAWASTAAAVHEPVEQPPAWLLERLHHPHAPAGHPAHPLA
jgi:hypothetical protein